MASIFNSLPSTTSHTPVPNAEVAISLVEFCSIDKNSNPKYAPVEPEATTSQALRKGCNEAPPDPSNRPDSLDTSSANLRFAEEFNVAITKTGSQCALVSGRSSLVNLQKLEGVAPDERSWRKLALAHYFGRVFAHWKVFSLQYSDSLYMIPFQIILLGMMASLFYMGIAYINKCPMSVLIPALLLLMGLFGTVTAYIRMTYVIYKFLASTGRCNGSIYFIHFINYLFFIAYTTEIGCYLCSSPSFDEMESKYCNPTLYSYISWMNWAILFMIIIVLILHGPAFLEQLFRRNSDDE